MCIADDVGGGLWVRTRDRDVMRKRDACMIRKANKQFVSADARASESQGGEKQYEYVHSTGVVTNANVI